MKVLVYRDARGPAVVFLKPAAGSDVPQSAEVPDDGVQSLSAPAYAQVASRGAKATWEQHCQNLVRSAPYAGRWAVEEVLNGSSPRQALRQVRENDAMHQVA